jgi:hypothetical protein
MAILRGPVGTAQSRFWDWFRANESRLFDFERDQERLFGHLASALANVHPNLTFEFGPVVNGRREFVISAGGIKAAFSEVEKLATAAPPLERWQVTRFRPRRFAAGHLSLANVTVDTEQVFWVAEPVGPKFGLIIFIPRYAPTPESVFEQIGYLLLDQALGEFDVETKIDYIEFAALPSPTPAALRSLDQLGRLIDGAQVT